MTIRASAGVFGWMQECGVRFQPSLTGTLNLSRTNAFFLGGGKALVNAYYLTAERLGVDMLYDTKCWRCTWTTAPCQRRDYLQGFPQTVHARCVVASSGGFQANLEWMRQYWGDAVDNFVIRGTPYNRGRVLKNLLDQGVASVGDPTQCHAVALDARAPKFDGGITTRLDSVPFSIVVNRDAERFYDEGEDVWPKRYAIWGRLIAQQPGQIAYSICDAKSVPLFMPSVYPAVTADSLGELAEKLGLDPIKLRAAVSRLTSPCTPGRSTHEAGRLPTEGLEPPKTNWARVIDTPPFTGYPLRPGITFTYLGVRVDERAQVLMEDGRPAGNLFAAGEIMAGNILGRGYLAGFGMTSAPCSAGSPGKRRHACEKLMPSAKHARDGGLQRLPLLRGLLRRVPRHGTPPRIHAGDLSYLANLCHNCRGCYYACQYAPPHEWGINVPPSLAQVRAQSYQEYAWPQPLARAFHRNGVVVSLVTAVARAGIILTALLAAPDELYSPHPVRRQHVL